MKKTTVPGSIARSILLKEGIKLRLLVWVPFLVLAAALVDVLLTYRGIRAVHGPVSLWADLIYKQSVHFTRLQWAFIFSGLWFASVQFLPECAGKRLRLLFHLPVSHTISLYAMVAVGFVLCLTSILFTLSGFWAVAQHMGFPAELCQAMLLTLLPWGLAAFVAYCAAASAIAEPEFLRKAAFAMAGYVYISLLTYTQGFAGMGNSIWLYVTACLPWPFALEAAALRVKEGKS